MQVWKDTLQLLIRSNDWPYIEPAHKSKFQDLLDGFGRVVGMLEAEKRECRLNQPYRVPLIMHEIVVRAVRRADRGSTAEIRVRAAAYVQARMHRLRERLADVVNPTQSEVARAVAELVAEFKAFPAAAVPVPAPVGRVPEHGDAPVSAPR